VVIFDITGMKDVNAGAAETLIRAAGALRMLGARTVLTGVRAEVARMLVELGLDMRSIVTRATLEDAIAWARARR
jgi:anti-anti-sigma regulatory factor